MIAKQFGGLKSLFKSSSFNFATAASIWKEVPLGEADPILGIAEAFKKDTDKRKVNLGVGAYRDDSGKPIVLDCVRLAEKTLYEANIDHEYLPIGGLDGFILASLKLAYGENSTPINDKRWVGIQALSGTGSLRLGFAFIQRYLPGKTVYITNPTWPTHRTIAQDCFVPWKEYTYYDPKTKGLNFEGMLKDMDAAPNGSVFLLHPCAHNPTGVDLTQEQWRQVLDLFLRKNHFPFFDMAYQGFATGDFERDAYAVRLFSEKTNIFLSQSFAKNLGLYGERIGCFSATTSDLDEANRLNSQFKWLARALWSNPPLHGARIAHQVMTNPTLNKLWLEEVEGMANRIHSMRVALTSHLKDLGSTHDWTHITNQIGMFAFTGLNADHCSKLTNDHHIYLTKNGRISIAGLNSTNVRYVAEGIHDVTKNSKI